MAGFWLAFALYPVPGPGFDWQSVGVPAGWTQQLSGFEAHWTKGANLSEDFDRWFLNLFPREQPFVYNHGSWATLNFIPTLATMLFGLLAGWIVLVAWTIRRERASRREEVAAEAAMGRAAA